MEAIRLDRIAIWCRGNVIDKNITKKYCYGISTDSRRIKKGDLFIALKGDRFDGTTFVNSALQQGAVAAIIQENFQSSRKKIIKVKDTLKALGDIAKAYRNEFDVYVIGITGSDGKTTTKEFIKNTLSIRYNVSGTEGNFNNAIGLPLSIFTIDRKTDFCVLEMGMNRKNEIRYLGKIANPQAGIITTVGSAHIGFFKNIYQIAEAKSELIETLKGEKFCMFNYDNKFFSFFREKAPADVLSFGMKKGADIRGNIVQEENDFFTFYVEGKRILYKINFWNTTIIYPALIALGLGERFGITEKETEDVFEGIKPLPGRGKIYHIKGITVIDESYNCNPNSLKASLYNLYRKNFKRKIAIIGDMAELGKLSYLYHRNIGLFIKKINLDIIITFGEKSREIGKSSGIHWKHFEDMDMLNKHLSCLIKKGDAILIKGSRVMNMERIRDYLMEKYGG
ncbi:MAG: UDP-N-acetylmuramoyl-tripeptide--D-alanyl-D-alanine ligase [Candidatus Omnitrophica bacterium]|nr:UDP-N-acetylmuramoyl-tripeptide--D-alanyl-D-alanine ligase [Candidatus Omnitrophota bacterium]MCM8776912.1 UDP-N-acetylmuramoyl-tripeptide--D-alanyl-D-alanine ligase [Candidatus Omnitrophota bacterium]